MNTLETMRLDKWLWCARFYKTRSLATEEIGKGRVTVNGQLAKPSKEVKTGDTLELRIGHEVRTVVVRGLSGVRSAAPVAALLFEETAASLAQREQSIATSLSAREPLRAPVNGVLARTELMDRAIADLTQLCERAPTPERLNLLGSTHKRRALTAESDPDARLAALAACADAYLASFEKGGRQEAYPFTNWASAALLASRLDTRRTDAWRQDLESDIARLQAVLQTRYDSEPDFWDGVALADLELVRLLARCIGAPASGARSRRPASLPRPCAEIAERIRDGYRSVITRGASPRERASVLENLDCLVILLGQDLPALRKALGEIRDAL